MFCDMKYWVFFVYFESMQLLALSIFLNLLSGVCVSECSSCGLATGCDPYQTQEEMGPIVGTQEMNGRFQFLPQEIPR